MSSISSSAPPQAADVLGPAVVGGERGDLVAVEAVEQVAQVEGAVADVEVRVGEVVVDEGLAAAQRLDRVGGVGGDLHQAAGAGVRGLVGEARLLVDHRRDQRRVEVEALGLLADDVVVASGSVTSSIASPTSIRLTISAAGRDHGDGDHEPPRRGSSRSLSRRCEPVEQLGRAPPRARSSVAVVARPRRSPARPSPPGSAGGLARPSSSPVPARARRARRGPRRRRRPRSSRRTAPRARSRTAAAPRPPRAASRPASSARQATIRSPTSGCSVDSSQASSSGRSKTIAPTRARSTAPSGRDLGAPALDQQLAHALGAQQLVDDRVGRERRGAEAVERRERLGLAGGDRAGEADDGTGVWRAAATALGSGGLRLGSSASSAAASSAAGSSAAGSVLGRCSAAACSAAGGRGLGLGAAGGSGRRPRGGVGGLGGRLGEDLLGEVEVGHAGLGLRRGRLGVGLQLGRDQVAQRQVVVAPARA